jgi:hypothetical protein
MSTVCGSTDAIAVLIGGRLPFGTCRVADGLPLLEQSVEQAGGHPHLTYAQI